MIALTVMVDPGEKDVTIKIPARELAPTDDQSDPLDVNDLPAPVNVAPKNRAPSSAADSLRQRRLQRLRRRDGRGRAAPNERRHLIEAFLEMMSAERGAARNTIEAYRRDLGDYAGFLAGKGAVARDCASAKRSSRYLASLDAQGLAASSAARRLSALRQFHKFLCADQIRPDDPTRIVASPRARRPLPKVLSVAEVDRLLSTAEAEAVPTASPRKQAGGAPALCAARTALCHRHARLRAGEPAARRA